MIGDLYIAIIGVSQQSWVRECATESNTHPHLPEGVSELIGLNYQYKFSPPKQACFSIPLDCLSKAYELSPSQRNDL
jgi:hypothetical protein